MQRQLISLGLLPLAVMPILIKSAPVSAQSQFQTIEVNETEGRSKSLGQLKESTNYTLKGRLGGSPVDNKDHFTFTVDREAVFQLRFSPERGTLNSSKISLSRRGVTIASGQDAISNVTLKPGAAPYTLILEGESNDFVFYQANIITPKPVSRTITLEIDRAEALDTFDSGTSTQRKADFYVQSNINGTKQPTTKVIGNNNTPTFNHRVTQTVPADLEVVPLTVVLRDEDRLSKDDLADINPSSKNRGINIKYFPATRKIVNVSNNQAINTGSSFFTIQGNNGPKARLRFRIDHTNQ